MALPPEEKPNQILIIGVPRSGTSLLQLLLTTCFKGCWMPPEFEQRPSNYFWTETFPHVTPQPKTVIWKVPELPWKGKETFDRLVKEGTHVLAITRHPASVIRSEQNGKPYWQGSAYAMDKNGALERWFTMAAHMQRFSQGIDVKHFTMLKFEDLLQHPEVVQAKLAKRLDLEPTIDFMDAHLHMDASNPNVRAMNGIRPLDPERAKKASDEEARELGFEIPDAVRILAHEIGYPYEPLHQIDKTIPLTTAPVAVTPYAYGLGEMSPAWSFYLSPGAESQLDLAPLLDGAVAMTYGEASDTTFMVEGPCPLPQHDHPVRYRIRGNSALLVGRCDISQDFILARANPKALKMIRQLPPTTRTNDSNES